jgi:site-specific DNA-methyltransferase (adenine-specific)
MDSKTQQTMFSSKSPEWETPRDFFEKLDERWNFTLDPCATKDTAKCATFFTEKDNGLEMDWKGHRVFMNPPYGREIRFWIEKAYKEGLKHDTIVVCLLPARTDTKWFHNYCMKAQSIKFIKGRLKFGNATAGAPFPSMLVIFNGRDPATMYGTPTIFTLSR